MTREGCGLRGRFYGNDALAEAVTERSVSFFRSFVLSFFRSFVLSLPRLRFFRLTGMRLSVVGIIIQYNNYRRSIRAAGSCGKPEKRRGTLTFARGKRLWISGDRVWSYSC